MNNLFDQGGIRPFNIKDFLHHLIGDWNYKHFFWMNKMLAKWRNLLN